MTDSYGDPQAFGGAGEAGGTAAGHEAAGHESGGHGGPGQEGGARGGFRRGAGRPQGGGREGGGFRIRLSDNEMRATRALQEAFNLRSTVAVLGFAVRTLGQMLEDGELDALVQQQRSQAPRGGFRGEGGRGEGGRREGGRGEGRRGEGRNEGGRGSRPDPFARPAKPQPPAPEPTPEPEAQPEPEQAVDATESQVQETASQPEVDTDLAAKTEEA